MNIKWKNSNQKQKNGASDFFSDPSIADLKASFPDGHVRMVCETLSCRSHIGNQTNLIKEQPEGTNDLDSVTVSRHSR